MPHPGAIAVGRFLAVIRDEGNGGFGLCELLSPGLLAAIVAKMRAGEADYWRNHYADLANHYRPRPKARRA